MLKLKFQILLSYLVFCFIFSCSSVLAATAYFSPASGSYSVGSILSTSVFISSADQAMNAASGVISFPPDKLEVVSLLKSASIFSLWVQEPSFSNTAGTVNFEGLVSNPGFTGSSGKIMTVNFKVKSPGVADLSFLSGSILANDGQGSDILKSLGTAKFSLDSKGPTIPESTTPTIAYGTPLAPQISSPTHPDPNLWYSKKDAMFKWKTSPGIISTRLSENNFPRSTPTEVSLLAINEKSIGDLSDGIHYFHLQLRNSKGWGEISHFRFQIDTEKPSSFNITEIPRKDATEPKAKFIFDATDRMSGIDYYEVQIDGGDLSKWYDDGSKTYVTPALADGKHTLIAKVYDKAGNVLVGAAKFSVDSIDPPRITEYPKELQSGEILSVKGLTYPNSQVTIWLQREKDDAKSAVVKSDQAGKFSFVSDERLKDGMYKIWAEVTDSRGAKSAPSEKLSIKVAQSAFIQAGTLLMNVLAMAIPLASMVILLIIILLFGWRKMENMRKRLRKEVGEAEYEFHRSFDWLREDIRKQIKVFEDSHSGKQMTKEEENVLKQLKDDLDKAERSVGKEIDDIQKEIR